MKRVFIYPALRAGIFVSITMQALKNKKITWLVSGLVLGFFFGMLTGTSGVLEKNLSIESDRTTPPLTFSLMIDFGDGKLKTFQDVAFRGQETLFVAMERKLGEEHIDFGSKEYKGLGTLVTKIGEKESGDSNEYWQYWVNNRHPDVGADQYLVQYRDVILWKFSAYEGI